MEEEKNEEVSCVTGCNILAYFVSVQVEEKTQKDESSFKIIQ